MHGYTLFHLSRGSFHLAENLVINLQTVFSPFRLSLQHFHTILLPFSSSSHIRNLQVWHHFRASLSLSYTILSFGLAWLCDLREQSFYWSYCYIILRLKENLLVLHPHRNWNRPVQCFSSGKEFRSLKHTLFNFRTMCLFSSFCQNSQSWKIQMNVRYKCINNEVDCGWVFIISYTLLPFAHSIN